MALPTNFRELLVEVSRGSNYPHTLHVSAGMLATTERSFASGYRFTTNTNAGAQISISLTGIRLVDCYFNGSGVSDANMTVYYK